MVLLQNLIPAQAILVVDWLSEVEFGSDYRITHRFIHSASVIPTIIMKYNAFYVSQGICSKDSGLTRLMVASSRDVDGNENAGN